MSLYTYDTSHAKLSDLLGSHDTLAAFGNFDTLVGGSGNHDMFAVVGLYDQIYGASGAAETLFASDATDSIFAGTGGDTIAGSAVAFIGLQGNDTIMGADSVWLSHADTNLKGSTDKAGDTVVHFTDSGQIIQLDQHGIEIHFAGGGTLKS